MQLSRDGAQHFAAALTPHELDGLEQALASVPASRPGNRLKPIPELPRLLGSATDIATSILGAGAEPVRAVLFDKNPERNWALGWHQDRTIAVRKRIDIPHFTDWTVKSGIPHVVPPFRYLRSMLALRIHLDSVGPDNAPLLVVPGSHKLSRIAEGDIHNIVNRIGTVACQAERGDIWVYSMPILHASEAAAQPTRRRVLQVYYSADNLPGELEWLGV